MFLRRDLRRPADYFAILEQSPSVALFELITGKNLVYRIVETEYCCPHIGSVSMARAEGEVGAGSDAQMKRVYIERERI